MSPYKIEMVVGSYTADKCPLYTINIYSKDNKIIQTANNLPKETAIRYIAEYCCVSRIIL